MAGVEAIQLRFVGFDRNAVDQSLGGQIRPGPCESFTCANIKENRVWGGRGDGPRLDAKPIMSLCLEALETPVSVFI